MVFSYHLAFRSNLQNMIRNATLSSLLLLAFSSANAQSDCGAGRYTDPLYFDSVSVLSGVVYGANNGVNGQPQTLLLDVYQPVGDTYQDRPVVIVAFGGSFIAGTRQDVAELCLAFAHRGYVAIAPDYRVGFFFPTEATTTRAVVRSMHDLKACVRFLRKTVAEDGDPYGIDADRIIVGGVSAGAIGALHCTYLDQSSEIPPILFGDTATTGGVEGLSGSPGYSSDVLACYSMSGAIGDTTWFQAGDQPLCSIHEVQDGVVPYGTMEVSVVGIPTGLMASGSGDIHPRFDHLGIPNCFLSYPGNGHVGYLTSDPVNSVEFVAQFCANMVCGVTPTCGTLYVAVPENANPTLTAFPNPTTGQVTVRLDEASNVSILAADGRCVKRLRLGAGASTIDLQDLPDGLYILRTEGDRPSVVRVVRSTE